MQKNDGVRAIDEKYQNLVGMNIPKIQLQCSFTRKELYNIFTKFKALSKISMLNFPNKLKEIGVEKSVFMNGLKQLCLDNTDFLDRIFSSVDKANKEYLTWEEFFAALKLISSSDLNDKIDLFFQIVDADGNGNFSYDEIKEICELSMPKVDLVKYKDGNDRIREETSDFYAYYIFKILGKELDEEIPISDFK